MKGRRTEVQRQLVISQIQEINRVITQLKDAIDVSVMCDAAAVVISRPAASRAIRNLEDFERRYLVGEI